MLVYFLIFICLVTVFWLDKLATKQHTTRWLFWVAFIVLFLIAGFRHYSVGSDTEVYVRIFRTNMALPPLSEFFTSRFELGFLYLNDFIYNYVSSNYSIYLAIYSFATLAITFFVISKESTDIYLSLILFYTYDIYTGGMTNIRALLAMAFIYLAYYCVNRNKKLAAIAWIMVASSFHISSLIFLVAYVVRNVKVGGKGIAIIVTITLAGFLLARGTIESLLVNISKYEYYLDSSWYNDSGKLGMILGALTMIIVVVFGEYVLRGIKLTKAENFLRNIMLIAVMTSVLSVQVTLLSRFSLYFSRFVIFYVPLILSKLQMVGISGRRKKLLLYIAIIFIFGLRFFVILIARPEWNILVPYRNVLLEF